MADTSGSKRPLESGEEKEAPPPKRGSPATTPTGAGAAVNEDGLFGRLMAGLTAGDLVPPGAAEPSVIAEDRVVDRALIEEVAASKASDALVGSAGRPVGFFVMHDVVALLAALDQDGEGGARKDFVAALFGRGHTAGDFVRDRHPFQAVDEAAPALDAVRALLRRGVHTVAVTRGGGARHLLTQRDVLSFLADRKADVKAAFGATLGEARLGSVLHNSVLETKPAREVLAGMSQEHLSAVAVVDARGLFMTNVSDADLAQLVRGTKTLGEARRLLALPVLDLLSQLRQAMPSEGVTATPTFNAHLDDTVAKVVAKVVKARRNRIFVTSPSIFKPVSVVTASDLLRHVASV